MENGYIYTRVSTLIQVDGFSLDAQEEEIRRLEGGEGKENRPNSPVLLTGMTPIKFTMPTDTKMGEIVETTADDTDW